MRPSISTSRRRFLQGLGGTVAIAGSGAAFSASQGPSLESIVEAAHAEIWKRFIDARFDVLLHYAGLKGEVFLPTAEECRECQPNGMSWSTPIEDGPFFGGLFLDGLCLRWSVKKDEESARVARGIAAGLLKLSDFSQTPGFVPRGIAADGGAFYPASSEDQVFPWIYGLWRYRNSGLADKDERLRIEEKLRTTILAIQSHQWRIPCGRPDFGYRGDFTRANAHDAARLLFLLLCMHELTGDAQWIEAYQLRLKERIGPASKIRLEICEEGLHYTPAGSHETFIWTHSMSQAALRALAGMEVTDEETAAALRRGLRASAERVAPHLDRAMRYDRQNNGLNFDVDWRFLKPSWKAQHTCEEAIALARTQLKLWAEHNPRSPYEDDVMREPLFAAWIIRLAGDAELNKQYDAKIESLLRQYEWTGLYTATFFVAVNVFYEAGR